MHFSLGGQVFHIHQFAEIMARNGHTYEPAEPISRPELFEKRYLDRSLTGNDGHPIPYRMIWTNNNVFLGSEDWYSRQMPLENRQAICFCPAADRHRQVCLVNGKFTKEFLPIPELYNRLPDITMATHEHRQIKFTAQQVEQAQSLDGKLQDAARRAIPPADNTIMSQEKNQKIRQEEPPL